MGQTQSLIHAGWHNASTEPRKAIYTTWLAAESLSALGGHAAQAGDQFTELSTIHPRIRELLRECATVWPRHAAA